MVEEQKLDVAINPLKVRLQYMLKMCKGKMVQGTK